MAASIVCYAGLGELLGRKQFADGTYFYAASGIAISVLGVAIVVRRTLVLPSENRLKQKPDDVRTVSHWRKGYLFLYAICELLGLLGLGLRLLGFPLSQIWSFYLGSLLLLLLFSPRPPRTDRISYR